MTSVSNKIIAVVPAFNESKTISAVVNSLRPYVSLIIVADDCSSDDTRELATGAGAIVLSHDYNVGYDKNLDDGFKEAAKQGADIFFTFDADGEHEATDVPRILAPILSGEADIVVAQRPFTTHTSEKIFAFYTWLRYGITDPICGFKAYSRRVYDAVGCFDSIESTGTELMLQGLKKGFKLALMPIKALTRVDDSSRYYRRSIRANLRIFKSMLRVIFL